MILWYGSLILASVAVTLGGCALFTNGIEWLGKRLGVSEGAVGSIFAAVGTTLPETSIPIIAIFFGTGREQAEVGLGAILGAPFMLSTLVIPILALLLMVYAQAGKRTARFHLNYGEVRVDLTFFLIGYGVASGSLFVPSRSMHILAAVGLFGLYLWYLKIKLGSTDEEEGAEGSALEPLLFAKQAHTPPYVMIGLQGLVGIV